MNDNKESKEQPDMNNQSLVRYGFMGGNTIKDAVEYAKVIASSDYCPAAMKGKPNDVVLALQMGRELGLPPVLSLWGIAVIKGRPTLYGDALLGVCLRSPDFEYIKEEYDPHLIAYTCSVKRRGRPEVTYTYSKEDAKTAGLWGKPGPWTTNWKRMLQHRARGFCLRDCYADMLMGMISREEANDYPDAVRVTEAIPVQEYAGMDEDTLSILETIVSKSPPERVQKWLAWAGVDEISKISQRKADQIIDKVRDSERKAKSDDQISLRELGSEEEEEEEEEDEEGECLIFPLGA